MRNQEMDTQSAFRATIHEEILNCSRGFEIHATHFKRETVNAKSSWQIDIEFSKSNEDDNPVDAETFTWLGW